MPFQPNVTQFVEKKCQEMISKLRLPTLKLPNSMLIFYDQVSKDYGISSDFRP